MANQLCQEIAKELGISADKVDVYRQTDEIAWFRANGRNGSCSLSKLGKMKKHSVRYG